MARYWGIHNALHEDEERKGFQGMDWLYETIPVREEMQPGDFVYLFHDREYLYGWGTIRELGPLSPSTRDVTVSRVSLRPSLASFGEIDNNPAFNDWASTRRENLSLFNAEQIRHLNVLCKRNGSAPPDPDRLPWEDTWEIVERRTRRGNQGAVTTVRKKSDGVLGALKELHVDHLYREERRYRMQQEVNALRALMRLADHNGTPRVLDDNSQDWDKPGVPLFLVMEWIDGVALDEFENKGRSIDQALATSRRLLEIIDTCHKIPIYHRDLKPDNIILRAGELTDPVLVDFGMSWSKPPENEDRPFETHPGQEIGNRFLRLPEYAPGRDGRDSRSDLTMLVGVLFFLVCGRAPRQLSDENGRMPHESNAMPQSVASDTSWPRLQRLFRRGFQSSINDRFQSADELSQALGALSANQDTDPVAEALQKLDDLRTSQEIRRRKVARVDFQQAHELISRTIATVDSVRSGLKYRTSEGITTDGRAADWRCQFFRVKGGTREIIFQHRLRLQDESYIASIRVVDRNNKLGLTDWWQYYGGPSGDLDLLLGAVEQATRDALARVIDAHHQAISALLEKDPYAED